MANAHLSYTIALNLHNRDTDTAKRTQPPLDLALMSVLLLNLQPMFYVLLFLKDAKIPFSES